MSGWVGESVVVKRERREVEKRRRKEEGGVRRIRIELLRQF